VLKTFGVSKLNSRLTGAKLFPIRVFSVNLTVNHVSETFFSFNLNLRPMTRSLFPRFRFFLVNLKFPINLNSQP
jgi:hypothetical protein